MAMLNVLYILMAITVGAVYVTSVKNHSSKISNLFILFMFIQILASISSIALIPVGNAKLIEWFISIKIFDVAIAFLPLVWFMFVYEYLGKKVSKRIVLIFGVIYSSFFIGSLFSDIDGFTLMFFDRLSPQNINDTFYIASKSTLLYFGVTFTLFVILTYNYIKEIKKTKRKLNKEILLITLLILALIVSEFYTVSQILYDINISMFLILLIALVFLKLVINNQIKNLIQISNSLILDELPTAILILDSNKNIAYANKNAIAVFGKVRYNHRFYDNENLKFINDLYTNESFEQNYESKVSVVGADGKKLTFIATRTAYSEDFEIVRLQDISAEENNVESLHKKSRIDGLTELLNKSTFYNESNEIIALCNILNQPYAVVMFDLDKFKYVNDTYGHQNGDKVLIKLARMMDKEIYLESLIGRFGGEEFCGLIIDEKDAILKMLDKFRQSFKEVAFEYEDSTFNVTVSIGVAFSDSNSGLEELLDFADQALYNSKNTGRDKITVYESGTCSDSKND